jgi:hypothetical protein
MNDEQRGFALTIDSRNNLIIGGSFRRIADTITYYNSIMLKWQPSLQDWDCFFKTINYDPQFKDIPAASWVESYQPKSFGSTYSYSTSTTAIALSINNYSPTMINYEQYTGGCTARYLVVPQLPSYYYQFNKGSFVQIPYTAFQYCQTASSSV